ncbi:DUF1003 domain-containing protein [Candidatus Microgenomates bacterium]|nr:DUF1003 domain-containing protein [Candidatus Microgenomates bacterium]
MNRLVNAKQKKIIQRLHSLEGHMADKITKFSGSMIFVYFHTFWFAVWIVANGGYLRPFVGIFDPFPYGLLTMIVSLEAIFLSTFIMVAHNRQVLFDEYRDIEENIEDKETEKEVEDIQKDLDDLKNSLVAIQKKLETSARFKLP